MEGYLSFSTNGASIIVQGGPVCSTRPIKDALEAAKTMRITLEDRAWNGDRGEWVSLSTISELENEHG